jgi:hypothetical protein
MYENLRLTELHEEWAWNNHYAMSDERCGEFESAERRQAKVEALDAEIRRRMVAQEIGPPFLSPFAPSLPPGLIFTRLLYGVPDAERVYPGRYDHWSNHARHEVPVASCHLCQEARRISAAMREAF